MEDDNPQFTIPEITPLQLAARLQAEPALVLLDVREPYELTRARLSDPRVVYAPLSELARRQLDALPAAAHDSDTPLVVFCHMGQRSAQVVYWLREIGWSNVVNLSGGIHAYASQVDRSIGFY
jgi:adenylyltransferase/sulfurtransferase